MQIRGPYVLEIEVAGGVEPLLSYVQPIAKLTINLNIKLCDDIIGTFGDYVIRPEFSNYNNASPIAFGDLTCDPCIVPIEVWA